MAPISAACRGLDGLGAVVDIELNYSCGSKRDCDGRMSDSVK